MSGFEGLLTGRVLADRYLVDEVIGRGGMGAVYRATDQRLGRAVALKVIMVPGADDGQHERLRRRFLREAQLAAGLRHTNVVTVHDFGTDDTLGLDYLVMALLEGEDLASRTAGGRRLSPAASLAVVSQAARGLAAGHRRGLVHRDVKPGNLFLEVDEHGEVQVRILDFGIAQLALDEPAHTMAGRDALSPTYAAPEQLIGASGLTPAVDVFSLAAVALYLLNGQRPFTGNAATQAAEAEAALAALDGLAEVTPAVRDVLRRALEMDPLRRWPDAATFGRALEAAHGPGLDTLPASVIAGSAGGMGAGMPDDDVTLFASPADEGTLHAGMAPPPAPAPPVGRGATAGPPPSSPPAAVPVGRRGAGAAPPPPRRGSMLPAVLVLGLGAAGALAYLQPWESSEPQVAAVTGPDSAALDSIARQAEADSIARIRRQQEMVQAAVDSVRMADSIARENDRLAQEAAGGGAFPPGGEVVFEDDDVYDLGQVERQPELRNTRDIQRFLERNYPPLLRDSRVDGEVMINFVLDEDGRPEMQTAQVTSASHPAFEDPALRAAERMRFRPAQISGQDVRVRVTLPIRFQTQ
ncbi:MAG TPA: TonB family protein [Longimicrobium sp.]|nr:TonB family protein [Longimicrobium sp.]